MVTAALTAVNMPQMTATGFGSVGGARGTRRVNSNFSFTSVDGKQDARPDREDEHVLRNHGDGVAGREAGQNAAVCHGEISSG